MRKQQKYKLRYKEQQIINQQKKQVLSFFDSFTARLINTTILYEVSIKQITLSSPSYYYQSISQDHLNNQEFDKYSNCDRSLSQFSNQSQIYPFYQNKIIPRQSNIKREGEQPHQKNRLPNSKTNLLHDNQNNHQQYQYPSNHNMFYNQDRSLKVNQNSQQLLINKNKSHSSPSNQPSQKKPFKKIKQTKQLQPLEKSKVSKYNFKTKKPKVSKQKKISNGSSSTANTKTGIIKAKKKKIQNRKVEEKGHQAAKSSQNNSQHSNEFLILGDNLYDYQDLSRVTMAKQYYDSKLHTNGVEKSTNKKIKIGEYERQLQLSRKHNDNSLSIYDPAKLSKKVNNTIAKIQKYMLGFIEAQTFQSAKQQTLQDTESMPMQDKLKLYHELMKDSQLSKQLQVEKKMNQEDRIDDVIKLSIEKVQKKSQKLSEMYKQQSGLISKWKNSKLHQLSTAKKILQKLMQPQRSHSCNNKRNSPQSIANHQQILADNTNNNKYNNLHQLQQQISDIQSDPLYLLEKQLQQVMSEQYYPQLKKHTLTLRKSLNDLLKNQHFPQPKPVTHIEVVEKSRLQNTQNYFTPNAVLWFFDKFFNFITEKANYIPQLVDKLNQGFGFDVETKKAIAKEKNLQKWHEFFGQGETSVHHKPMLDEFTLRRFQQQVIKPDPQLTAQTLTYMHHFNHAIIDSFNQQFHRFRPFYPNGQPLPFIQKPGKYFQITGESIFFFFEKAKYHIYTNYITCFAGLILPEGQEETKQTKQYNVGKQIKLTNQQLLYDWEFYHCLLPVAKLATIQQLYIDVQAQIFNELTKDMLKTFKLKLK